MNDEVLSSQEIRLIKLLKQKGFEKSPALAAFLEVERENLIDTLLDFIEKNNSSKEDIENWLYGTSGRNGHITIFDDIEKE